jgi:hypothetical protein
MAAGAAVAGLGERLQFDEAPRPASGDGRDHIRFGDPETPADNSVSAAAHRGATQAATGAIRGMVIVTHGGKAC